MYIIKFLIRYPSKLIFMRRPSLNSVVNLHTLFRRLLFSFMRPLFHFSLARWRYFHSHYTLTTMLHNRGMMGPLSKKKTEICELGPNSFFLPFLHFSPRANTARLYLCFPFFSPHWCSWEKNKKHKKDRVSIFFMCVLFALGREKSLKMKKEMGGRMQKKRRLKVRWNCSPERRELSFMH